MSWAPQAAVAWGQDTAGGSSADVPESAGMELFLKDRDRKSLPAPWKQEE